MKDGRNTLVILEGRNNANPKIIKDCVAQFAWESAELTLLLNRNQWDELVTSGSLSKKRRCFRGFATTKYSIRARVFWKGAMPKLAQKFREFVDRGSRVSSDIMENVPVAPIGERPSVHEAVKEEILKDAASRAVELKDNSSNGDSSDTHESVEKQDKRKHTKRGRMSS